jgi:hypothetical protein
MKPDAQVCVSRILQLFEKRMPVIAAEQAGTGRH